MQKIKIRESHEEFEVRDLVHPFLENGILYLRMIEVDEEDNPTHFLSVMPMDILWRRSTYDQEIMDEINTASDKARVDQAEHMAAQEEIDDTIVDEFEGGYHG
jgi:hypothetical protein